MASKGSPDSGNCRCAGHDLVGMEEEMTTVCGFLNRLFWEAVGWIAVVAILSIYGLGMVAHRIRNGKWCQ